MRPAATSIVALLLAGAVLAVGCADDTGMTTTQTPTTAGATTTSVGATTTVSDVPSTVPSLPADDGLTLGQVRNAEIIVPFDEDLLTFTLVDGSYEGPQGGDHQSSVSVTMSDPVVFGDLNGDGVDDAAIAISVSKNAGTGGSGMGGGATGTGGGATGTGSSSGDPGASHYVVALVSQGREPILGGSHLVGVGARVDALSIADGEIFVEATVPGPEDPTGDPTVPITATLRLPLMEGTGWVLLHTSQTSETPAGDIREITITSPELGADVAYLCTITGTVTIAPFENNLVYSVYDEEMILRDGGPVTVDAPDYGAPGAFELVLDLVSLGCWGRIFVTISDLSAADGSILAMDSIELHNLAPT